MKHIYQLILLIGFFSFTHLPGHGQNLVANGTFENNFTSWNNLAQDGASAIYSVETSDVAEGSKAFKVVVETLGTNPWSIQAMNSAMTLQESTQYTLTFSAKSLTPGSSIRAVLQNTSYTQRDFALTDNWNIYTWSFTAAEASLQLKFQFFETGTFLIDKVVISDPTTQQSSTTDTLTINPAITHQTMDGFGAALAFYEGWISAHPNKEEMYAFAFDDLGLDWLRIRNSYRGENTINTDAIEFVSKAKEYTNDEIKVLMCSWTPPAELKSNDSLNNGTLKKVNGNFVYNAFAQYWYDALIEYGTHGIYPDWISIQNEPDYLTTQWETCKFTPTETAEFPGYDKALDSVYNKIKDLPSTPLLLGAEALGIGYNNFTNYQTPINDKPYLFGHNYHLYHGGDPEAPDSYIGTLNNIKNNYGDKPNMMTEYEHAAAGWLKSGWLINNVLTQANASAYFYWDLIWPDGGLIDIDNPWDNTLWENSKGFKLNPMYYMFKHYSKNISPGYIRIDGTNKNSALRTAVFASPDSKQISIVIVNTADREITSRIQMSDWSVSSSEIIQSAGTNYYQSLGGLSDLNEVTLPGSSITTVVLNTETVTSSNTIKNSKDLSLGIQYYPNPFGDQINLSATGNFSYSIQDLSGRSLESGYGHSQISAGHQLEPGIYFVKLTQNGEVKAFTIRKQ